MAAAIATWQSAYGPRGPETTVDRTGLPLQRTGMDGWFDSGGAVAGVTDGMNAVAAAETMASNPGQSQQQQQQTTTVAKKTVAREGGGKKWTDESLLEWDPSHQRIFVGNLGGETTSHSLLAAFSRWPSVQKARVIRHKATRKSKGYGFVSFSDVDDFFAAAKEMNGKYIDSHPVVIRKATTEINIVNEKGGGNGYNNSSNKNKNGRNYRRNRRDDWDNERDNDKETDTDKIKDKANGRDPVLGPINPGRITKPGQKTKNGLRLLG